MPAPADSLQLGVAAVTISPPDGIGYCHERGSDGTLDDIHAKAMVLDDGWTRAAVVVCDLISRPKWAVLFRESIRDVLDGAAKPVSRDYSQSLPQRIADAVSRAWSNRHPVQISASREREDHLSFNRRFWLRDGTVGWNLGKLNTNILRPGGPIDPEVGVFRAVAASLQRSSVLTLVNFAMHPDTVGGTRISVDYPGALARQLALHQGPDMLTIFANGPCGTINHINVRWAAPQGGPGEAHRIGTVLAAAVFKAMTHLESVDEPLQLQVRSAVVSLPLRAFTTAELE